jgi:hypothetical protein
MVSCGVCRKKGLSMAKRKPTDTAQMNLRLPEKLRKMIEVEARKNGWSLNRELVRRLQQSFMDQGVQALIKQTALTVAIEVTKNVSDLTANQHEHINALAMAIGRPDLTISFEKGEPGNG